MEYKVGDILKYGKGNEAREKFQNTLVRVVQIDSEPRLLVELLTSVDHRMCVGKRYWPENTAWEKEENFNTDGIPLLVALQIKSIHSRQQQKGILK